jgi:HAD superfamily hydrolase (TIGR01509 family)
MIEAVIFDMDGLMFGTEQLTRELWDKLGEELGYHNISVIIPETMGVRFNESEPIFKRRFGPDFPFTVFAAEYLRRFTKEIQTHGVPVKEGLYDLLEYLRQEHFICAIASSTMREKVLEYCNKANVTQYFQTFICGDMVEKCKPDPQIYLTTAQVLGIAPSRCMVLEDSPNGCLSAIRAGMKTVMVPDQVQPTEELRAKLAACVPTLRDVIPLLKEEREAQP